MRAETTITMITGLTPYSSASAAGRCSVLDVGPGQDEDDRGRRQDEGQAGRHEADATGAKPSDLHRHLGRVRAGQEVGEADEVDHLLIGQPAPALNDLALHEGDVGGRAAETDDAERAEDEHELAQAVTIGHAAA